MRFDLVDLNLFIKIVEAQSYSKGASAASLSLAAASARVSGMETVLGIRLLDRGPKGVTPTLAGQALLGHARTVLAQIEVMKGDLREYSRGLRGTVHILSNTGGLVELVPSSIRNFLADHPGISVEIREARTSEIVKAIAEGKADFGVCEHIENDALHWLPLLSDRLVIVLPETHRLAECPQLKLMDIAEEPFIALQDGALHINLAEESTRLGHPLKTRIKLRSYDYIIEFVAAGVGVSIIPSATLLRNKCIKMVKVVHLGDSWANMKIAACVRELSSLSNHAKVCLEEIQRYAQLLEPESDLKSEARE